MNDVVTLGEALPREIARVRDEVLPEYLALEGTPGVFVGFAVNMMRQSLDAASKAMIEGDLPAMIRAYESLKGFSV